MIWFIIGIISLIIIGFISNVISVRRCSDNYNFIVEYRDNFSNFIADLLENKKVNSKDYEWLVSNSDEVQIFLGDSGKISYKDRTGYYSSIPIVLNFMNEVLDLFYRGLLGFESEQITWCHNAFLRRIGALKRYMNTEIKNSFNPFYDLASGIRVILGIPLDILYSIGLVSSTNKGKIKEGKFFKILSGIFSLITIISTIMSFVLDWNDFINLIKGFLHIT